MKFLLLVAMFLSQSSYAHTLKFTSGEFFQTGTCKQTCSRVLGNGSVQKHACASALARNSPLKLVVKVQKSSVAFEVGKKSWTMEPDDFFKFGSSDRRSSDAIEAIASGTSNTRLGELTEDVLTISDQTMTGRDRDSSSQTLIVQDDGTLDYSVETQRSRDGVTEDDEDTCSFAKAKI